MFIVLNQSYEKRNFNILDSIMYYFKCMCLLEYMFGRFMIAKFFMILTSGVIIGGILGSIFGLVSIP